MGFDLPFISTMNLEIPESVKVWSQFAHPVLMWVLFAISLYALYLGVQIRRTRKADGDLKKQLIKGKFSDRHHRIGSVLLLFAVMGTLGGMLVTYINNGKLFVGPHLLAGLGMVAILTAAVSLVPYMQKGQTWARVLHIALNLGMLIIFTWQAATGLEIVQRIIDKITAVA